MDDHRVLVTTPQGVSGRIQRSGPFIFTFDPAATPASAPALGMPVRANTYEFPTLHPVFQMNMPEGYVLEQIRKRLAKTGKTDPMLLLSVIGSKAPIGRLRYTLEGLEPESVAGAPPRGERLADLLANKGSKALFSRLVDDYVLSSGLSGVQPKVLVPEQADGDKRDKAVIGTSDLIVKSGLDTYPGLSINEFFCMTVVKRAGIKVPEFYLSEDGELFIMRRFDRPPDGSIRGFEDMCCLAGRAAEEKYKGSYALVLRLLRLYCSPAAIEAAKTQLFDMVALSCILGNGDAHLKNFGVVYDSLLGEVSMAPAYDIVCTRLYIPEDTLALSLDGNQTFFAARAGLRVLGRDCDIPAPAVDARLKKLAQLSLDMLEEMRDTVARLPGLREVIEPEARMYLTSFKNA